MPTPISGARVNILGFFSDSIFPCIFPCLSPTFLRPITTIYLSVPIAAKEAHWITSCRSTVSVLAYGLLPFGVVRC